MHQSPTRPRRCLIAAAALAAIGSTAAQAADVSWIGPNASFWDLAANWSLGMPTVADDVLLGNFDTEVRSGSRTVQSLVGTGQLRLTGGALGMTQTSSVGSLSISAGNLGGAGNLTVAGALSITDAGAKGIGFLTLNAGSTTWSGNTGNGNNTLTLSGAGVFNSAGTFTDANAFNSNINAGGGGGIFNNAGTFNKESNTTTAIGAAFNNTGTVNVQAGLLLPGGGGTSSGTFVIASGARLEFRNGVHTLNNVTTGGAGTLQISTENVGADAFVSINGGTHTSLFLLSGSTLGGTDQLFQGAATWTGGAITGAAATTFGSTLAITGANTKSLGSRAVSAGNTTWSDNTGSNNTIAISGGGSFTNTGTFSDANTFNSAITVGGGGGSFNNNGSFNKQSNTTTFIGTVFNSTGTVNVDAGTMLMGGGGTSSGVFNIAAGAKLEYRNGGHTLDNVTTSGLGTLEISTENVGADATVAINGGTHTTAFVLSGSTLTGTSHTFQGAASWSGGRITGAAPASTTFGSTLAISGPLGKTLSGGRSVNNGNTTWSDNTGNGNNAIAISGASAFNNTGNFTDANTFDSAINVGGGGGAFNNNGVFNKQSNTITAIRTQFNNTGTANVNAGTMLMHGGGTSSGVFNIAAGAKLEYRNGSHVLDNATTSGAGLLEISTENVGADAVVSINGGTHTTPFLFSGSILAGTDHTFEGPVTWTGGRISGLASTTFDNSVSISGATTKVLLNRTLNLNGTTTWSGNTGNNNNAIRFWNGATINNNGTFNDSNAFASFIEHNVGSPHRFNNIGTYNKLSNTVTSVDLGVLFDNSGTLNIDAGTMLFISGTQGPTGTVNVAAGATFQQTDRASSTVGRLVTAGNTGLDNKTLTVHIDYDNANFGVGNDFNRRANVNVVTGGPAQRLLAAGDVNQGVTGAGVGNGNTANPTLTIGNVHVGATTVTYNVANTGTNGPSLRGAIQTSVNGANITDARLSGNGVQSSNWGPVAPGASTSRDITITIAEAGTYTPFSAQAVNLINNFENTRSQLLTINSAAGAAAYRLAAANTQPTTINFGNVLVGSTQAQALNIQNTASADGFSERLDARFLAGGTTGAATNNGASIGLLVAGASDNTAMSVGVNTATIGAKTGQVIVAFDSNGLGTSGLGITSLPNQNIGILADVAANVGTLAQASAATPNPVNFGSFRVAAAGAGPQSLTISNLATIGEGLNASIATGSAGFAASGSFTSLAPQATNNSSLQVSFNGTGTAGAKAGTATLTLVSDGTFNGGTTTPLPTQTVTMNANVYNAAVGSATPTPVVVANQRVGGSNSAALTVSNTAAAGAFSEDLRASFGANSGAASNNGGIIAALLAGSSNATTMSVGVNTASAGAQTGSVTLNYQTTGTVGGVSNGLALATANAPQTINLSGNVYQLASGALQTPTWNFGTVQVGQSITQDLVVRNTASGAAGFVEDLNASFGSSGNSQITGAGSLSGIAAGSDSTAANGTMTVTVTGATAGALNSSIGVNYFSAGAVGGVSNGLGSLAVGSENHAVNGTISAVANVINPANPLVNTPRINLGAARVGAAAPSATVSVRNVAGAPPQAALNASITSGGAPVTASGSFNLLAPGATNSSSLQVGMSTATAGAFNGNASIAFVSDASNVGNCAPNCQVNLASQNVAVSGTVYTPAVAQLNTPVVNFGIVHKNDVVAAQNVSVTNAAAVAAPNDDLRGNLGGASGAFTASGMLAGVVAQATDNSSLSVALNTANAGVFNGNATASFASHNAEMSGLDLGTANVVLQAQVNNYAELQLSKTAGAGSFSFSGGTYTLDFGNLVQGSAGLDAALAVLNSAAGPADLLSGSFALGTGSAFTLSGFGPFAGLAAGQEQGGLEISFDSSTLGDFTRRIVISSAGSNASAYQGALADTTLVLEGTVVAVPEPGTYALMAGGLLAVWLARRRKQRPA